MDVIFIVTIIVGLWWAPTSYGQCDPDCCHRDAFVPKVSVQSVNYPGRFWRHCSSLGFIDNNEMGNGYCWAAVYHQDVTWMMLSPGLAGGSSTVSFESVNYPGHFLRHTGFRLRMDIMDSSDLYKKDATFTVVDGMARGYGGNSFRSVNYPDYYIRHCANKLYIDNNGRGNEDCNTELSVFLKDITFHVTTGLAALDSMNVPYLSRRVL